MAAPPRSAVPCLCPSPSTGLVQGGCPMAVTPARGNTGGWPRQIHQSELCCNMRQQGEGGKTSNIRRGGNLRLPMHMCVRSVRAPFSTRELRSRQNNRFDPACESGAVSRCVGHVGKHVIDFSRYTWRASSPGLTLPFIPQGCQILVL